MNSIRTLVVRILAMAAMTALVSNSLAGYLFYEDFEGYEVGERPDWEGFDDATQVIEVDGEKLLNTRASDRQVWIPGTDFGYPITMAMDFYLEPGEYYADCPVGVYFAVDLDRPEEDGPDLYGVMLYGQQWPHGNEVLNFVAGDRPRWNENSLKRESDLGFMDEGRNVLEKKSFRLEVEYDGLSITASLFDLYDDGVLVDGWPVSVVEWEEDSGDPNREGWSVQPLTGGIGYHSHMSSFNINSITVIPEPSTLALLGLGGLLLLKRRSN